MIYKDIEITKENINQCIFNQVKIIHDLRMQIIDELGHDSISKEKINKIIDEIEKETKIKNDLRNLKPNL